MALYIRFKLPGDTDETALNTVVREKIWHVGSHISRPREMVDPATVTDIQAGGEELRLIYKRIGGIRRVQPGYRYDSVVRWHGEDARFIIDNL